MHDKYEGGMASINSGVEETLQAFPGGGSGKEIYTEPWAAFLEYAAVTTPLSVAYTVYGVVDGMQAAVKQFEEGLRTLEEAFNLSKVSWFFSEFVPHESFNNDEISTPTSLNSNN